MTDSNTAIWDRLGKTNPAHTKEFNRAGGFKGTAIKPQWAIRRLTEEFGPCGVGWGMGEPSFQVVPTDGEVLVFCTVSAWHGDRANTLYGVGGDKVQAKRSSGSFSDDEAFKKAFTDAVMNAFKFVGSGADVHMGLFDDSKYVSDLKAEFDAPDPAVAEAVAFASDGLNRSQTQDALRDFWNTNKDGLKERLPEPDYRRVVDVMKARAAQLTPANQTTKEAA